MPNVKARHRLDAGSYGTMGVGMGLVIAAAVVHPDKPITASFSRPAGVPRDIALTAITPITGDGWTVVDRRGLL